MAGSSRAAAAATPTSAPAACFAADPMARGAAAQNTLPGVAMLRIGLKHCGRDQAGWLDESVWCTVW